MQAELEALGIGAKLSGEVFALIDRKDKLSAEAWQTQAKEIGLDATQVMGIEALLQNKDLWKKSETMQRFFAAVEAQGAKDYIRYAPHIIRGLDYYTGTVFEAWDTAGEFRAIFGGGRYGNLVGAVGGEPLSGVGFAVGNVVISLLLQALGHAPDLSGATAPIYVTVFDEASLPDSLRLAAELRAAGLAVASHLGADKLQKQFKQADRSGAQLVLVLGPDEVAKKEVSVKDLRSGEQRSVARKDLVAYLQGSLKS
jgi:histidyl-tRNA synthetase